MNFLIFAAIFGADVSIEIPKLSVSGTSIVRIEPDQALIRFGVEEEDKNAETALKKTAEKITSIVEVLKPHLGKGTLTTENVSLHPIYEPVDPKIPKPAQTIGFRATSTLNVKTEDLSLIGRLIDLSSKAGANQIDSLTFSLQDDRSAKRDALTQATQNAIATAKTLAKAADIRLVRVLSIQEDSGRTPMYKMAYARDAMTESTFPVEPGEVEISAHVSLTYEIE